MTAHESFEAPREQLAFEILRKHSAQGVHNRGRAIEPSPAS
jgi:hypothetical protein